MPKKSSGASKLSKAGKLGKKKPKLVGSERYDFASVMKEIARHVLCYEHNASNEFNRNALKRLVEYPDAQMAWEKLSLRVIPNWNPPIRLTEYPDAQMAVPRGFIREDTEEEYKYIKAQLGYIPFPSFRDVVSEIGYRTANGASGTEKEIQTQAVNKQARVKAVKLAQQLIRLIEENPSLRKFGKTASIPMVYLTPNDMRRRLRNGDPVFYLQQFIIFARRSCDGKPDMPRPNFGNAEQRRYFNNLCELFNDCFESPCFEESVAFTSAVFDITSIDSSTAKSRWYRRNRGKR